MKRKVEIMADSVRANAMPAAVLWSVAIILAAGCHFVPEMASARGWSLPKVNATNSVP